MLYQKRHIPEFCMASLAFYFVSYLPVLSAGLRLQSDSTAAMASGLKPVFRPVRSGIGSSPRGSNEPSRLRCPT